MTVRVANRADVALISAFVRELAIYEKLEDEIVATDAMLERWLFGPQPAAEVLIAAYRGTPAGYALYFKTFSTFLGKPGLYLEDLYVRPEYRGKGCGKRLLTTLAEIAVERGFGRVEWAVLKWNKPAIDFYTSIGAEPLDKWTTNRLTGAALRKLGSDSSS